MLKPKEIRRFYPNNSLNIPLLWNLSRKHVRIQALDHKWIKLNKFENRLNTKELKKHLFWFVPLHVYFSVLDWLFPERVGKKYKGNYARPIGNGEFIIDVDAYVLHRWHNHNKSPTWNVCMHACPFALK